MNDTTVQHDDIEPKDGRQPLGRRDKNDVHQTVLRVVGKQADKDVYDVAAFQSFAD